MARKQTDSDAMAEPTAAPDSDETATSDVIINTGAEKRPTPTTELLRAEAGDVRAEQVSMERAGAEHVSADRVVMTNSGARTVEARSAQIDRSGILAVRSDKAVFSNSSVIAAAAEEARIVSGRVLALKADRATFEGDARIGVYTGPLAEGMRPLLDARAAAAFGAGLGAVLLLVSAVLRRIIGK